MKINFIQKLHKWSLVKNAFCLLLMLPLTISLNAKQFADDCPQCIVSSVVITNIKYYNSAGVAFTSLQAASQQGKSVKVCFTVPASGGFSTYSLVSYKAPFATFVRSAAHLQEVYDSKTITVGPSGGNFCLEINIPDCFFQVDFVKGCIIQKLGPADTHPNNFYGMQNRLYASAEGGNKSCVPDERLGTEGCTPGYWKQSQHFGNWAPAVPTGANATKFFVVFNVCDQANTNCKYQGLPANLTLLEALNSGGGGFNALARHAAAAYLNAQNEEVDYGMKLSDIVSGVVMAFKTGNSSIKDKLEGYNEKGCPLGRSELNNVKNPSISQEEVQIQAINQLSAYPTPFSSKATIEFTLNKEENFNVGLFDLQGRLVRNLKSGVAKAGQINQVSVESNALIDGLYLVKVVTKSEMKTAKLILKKQ